MSEDKVNPKHYKRGPQINGKAVEAIQVIRWITDARLANAMKYVWRVGFGGKDDNRSDIEKAIWYLRDYLDHPIDGRGNPFIDPFDGGEPA